MTFMKTTLTSLMSTVCASSARAFSASSSGGSGLRNRLKNPELLTNVNWDLVPWMEQDQQGKTPQFLDVDAIDRERTFPIYDPAEPENEIARLPIMGADETQIAIDHAQQALTSWRDGTTATQRANLLRQWSQKMAENADDLALIMTMESGKPLKESRGEVAYARSFLDYFAGEAVRPTGANGGFLVPTPFTAFDQNSPLNSTAPRGQIMAMNCAIGVTACITPWNFPAAMQARAVAPALAAGCVSVVKPSELTPLTALAMRNTAIAAGIPPHVLQLLTPNTDNTPAVGFELCTSSAVRHLSFTGSTAVGKQLMKDSSSTMKRLTMELGGNAPFIVFDDADMNVAISAAVASKFRNAGQTCVCADRFLIQDNVYDEFVEKFVDKVRELKVGSGLDRTTDVGPLISEIAAKRVHEKVQGAINAGAKCLVGGGRLMEFGSSSQFYSPTVLTDVPVDDPVWSTENFGPVAAIRSFSTEEEALAIANDSPVGLAGYFCTKDLSRALSFAKRLECGMVGINEGVISTCVAPFGGIKESGLGREGSPLGLAEYLETKYVFINA